MIENTDHTAGQARLPIVRPLYGSFAAPTARTMILWTQTATSTTDSVAIVNGSPIYRRFGWSHRMCARAAAGRLNSSAH